ncbi:type I polyketide synthase [Kitasatospora cineracea]|uniref:Phosphopantetheine binding protein n=1 Tax=Kitasatospora cineracea TaxID=88074 RepID=A0A3N4RCZ4_9ACTN|nr:type I polyketide synthase [Kitasatospora cineracea]RPE28531.1 phosphopantetheine binding protein [Kitasatospora cineracea]
MSSDIAIVGISVEVPGTRDVHGFWDLVAEGRNLTGRFPEHRARSIDAYLRYVFGTTVRSPADAGIAYRDGAYLEHPEYFDAEFFGMTPKQAATTEPHLRHALRAMYLAFEDAGYPAARLRGSRTGVFVGFAVNPGSAYLEYLSKIDRSLIQPALTGNVPTMMANRLSHLLDLRGPSMVVDSACSASLVAVHQAKNALLLGDCDTAVVAGARIVSAPIDHPDTRIGIESSDGRTRTLDERADGTGYGEGSGAVVLKRLDHALADGDRVYAVIKGSAVNHDGTAGGVTTPDSASQADLLHAAWADAGVDPRSIGYVELHGTATKLGDPIEIEGLRQAFAPHTADHRFCAVGTVKANIGHLFEGSGVLGLIKAALVLRHRTLPPLAGFEQPNSRIDFDHSPVRIPTRAEPWSSEHGPLRCGVSAFGLGGTNCHVVLEEHPDPAPAPAEVPAPAGAPAPQLFTLSAHSEESLRLLVGAYADWFALGRFDGVPLAGLCAAVRRSRATHRHRLALVVTGLDELRARLEALAANRLADAAPFHSSHPDWEFWAPAPGTAADPDLADPDLAARAAAWAAGADLGPDDARPGNGPAPRPVDLPPYEFDERRAWIDFPEDWREALALGTPGSAGPATHQVVFRPADGPAPAADPGARVLALVDGSTGAEELLRAAGLTDAQLVRLPAAADTDADAFYEELAVQAVEEGVTHLVHALGFEADPARDLATLDARLEKNLHGLFRLARALITEGAELHLAVLTRTALASRRAEPGVVVENSTLTGLAKSVSREYPYLTVSVVDTDGATPARTVLDELLGAEPAVVALRGGARLRETFAELPEAELADRGEYLKPGGTYLVTGGTAGLGLALCREFAARRPGINLVLLSRSGDPGPDDDPAGADTPGARLRAALRELRELGAEVLVLAADAGDPDALAAAVATVRERFGRIDGIVHAAGVPGGEVITQRTREDFDAVVRPKVHGAFALDLLTRDDRPDFVVHFSSVAAVFPAIGQADYAAANQFLDTLAESETDPDCHVITFDWVSWKEIGMAVRSRANVDTTFKALPTALGLSIADAGLRSGRARVFGGELHYEGDYADALPGYHIALDPPIADKLREASRRRTARREQGADQARREIAELPVELTGRLDGRYTDTELTIGRCWAHVFGFTSIDVDADLFDLGIDSITGMSLVATVTSVLGVEMQSSDLLVDRTVAAQAKIVDERRAAGPDGRRG